MTGLCECGCGEITNKYPDDSKYGKKRGTHYRYIQGHAGRIDLDKKFWKGVNKTDSCWIWTGARRNKLGYGGIKHRGSVKYTHRVSWELHFGEIPKGLEVCHKCDNPRCVNPSHLFLGTHSDNISDAFAKGRMPNNVLRYGVDHHRSKFSENDVIFILKSGERTKILAEKYGVTTSAIKYARKGKTYSSIYKVHGPAVRPKSRW